tara:strand:+ start:252 stop:1013 length:762 start_codon:yes stop_codon:yes gene_type:complete
MKLQDIYNQLAYGELRQVVLGTGPIGSADGMPDTKEHYAKILPFVKLGITELHKRFNLRERSLTLEIQPGQVSYVLSTAFAASNTTGTEAVKYILDSADPFQDDLMKIERIYGTYNTVRYEIPLNRLDDTSAIRTNSYNMLLIPSSTTEAPWLLETTELEVVYRADHPVIGDILANALPGRTDIYLPNMYLEPLIWYIASRATNPAGLSGEFHEGNNYTAKYEQAISVLKNTGIDYTVDAQSENNRLSAGGWV